MGVDGISLLFVILTTALMPICILASWTSIQKRVKEYMIAFLVLETLMIGVFSRARSGAVLPVLRGRPDPDVPDHRRLGRPAPGLCRFKFFLYTLLGSVLMLLAIMAMYWEAGTTDIPTLLSHDFPARPADMGCGSPSSPPSR